MKFSEGFKSFELCTNCSSEPATPAHIKVPRAHQAGLSRRSLADFELSESLHGFSDTSQSAYGAVVYCKFITSDGRVLVHLIASKSRVAPTKQTTIPRLELCAAVLLAKLVHRVKQALKLNVTNTFLWSESYQLKTFVANRIATIQEITSSEQWRYVSTEDNPADFIFRGMDSLKLKTCELWWNGPKFLMSNQYPQGQIPVAVIKDPDRLGKGEESTAIGKHFNLGESTVRAIKKNEAAIRKSVTSGTKLSTKFASYTLDVLLERTERAIAIWIEEQVQRRIPVSGYLIQEKALQFYKSMKQGECATADEGAAKIFPEELAKIIENGDYSADQVFNTDQTGLYRKKLPNRTYIAKDEKTASGHKASKDRVTLLLCSNASGDRMLKPLLINKSLRPRALKGKDLKQLPVHWMANPKAWMTKAILTKWFNNCFVP
ncbi:tigger transposable element-derived protein 1 [Trichonephila clavipes]|nr:tigger transposable element-derived protein 1 [Trichonephila clavipes]